jgi:WD40 repeat protein
MSGPIQASEGPSPAIRSFDLGAFITAGAFTPKGAAGFALGSGALVVADGKGELYSTEVNEGGALLSLAVDPAGESFLTGDDTGKIARIHAAGGGETVEIIKGKWIEHLVAHPGRKAFACAAGKEAIVVDAKGRRALGPCPSTIAGLAFSPDGSRLAAAHYGGVTVWVHDQPASAPRKLAWKGSHIAIAYAPTAKFLATATQENAIHVWRLANSRDMQMQGYVAKPRWLAWTTDGQSLTSSATEAMTVWPFQGDGPEGKPPMEFGPREGALVSAVVAHPKQALFLAGWDDGGITLADPKIKRAALVHRAHGKISALAFDATGDRALYGTEDGEAGLITLPGLQR